MSTLLPQTWEFACTETDIKMHLTDEDLENFAVRILLDLAEPFRKAVKARLTGDVVHEDYGVR